MSRLEAAMRTELEAAAFRKLVQHLQQRTDAQNIDLMNLAGFCRNCLANWMVEAAADRSVVLSGEDARHFIYGMDYQTWKEHHQSQATHEQKAAFKEAFKHHG